MSTAIYPGSFDPVTLGHLNIIKRAAACFDSLVVCVMVNSKKTGMFTPEERVELLKKMTPPYISRYENRGWPAPRACSRVGPASRYYSCSQLW